MVPHLAHLAQEDSRLPATPGTLGSVTRVVHELTLRLARRWPLIVYSTRQERSDAAEEARHGVRHVRFSPEPDRTLVAGAFRWRNRVGRRLGLPERPYPASPAYYWTYIRRVCRHLAQAGAGLVHFHNVSQFAPPLRAAAPRARLVLQMHCEWLIELPRPVIAQRLENVDLVLGVSEHIVRQIQATFPAVAPRCRVLHNGVDLANFPPRERLAGERSAVLAALRVRLGLGSPVVLYVGRLSSEKGVHVLLEAFGRLRLRHPGATCLVIGPDWGPVRKVRPPKDEAARLDADYVGHLRRLAARHGGVLFIGPVPNGELPIYHALADVLVAPSLLESFGIPAIEAGASGLPVIASAVGGLLDTVVPGRTGLLVPPDDVPALAAALEEIVTNPDRARAFGRAGRDRVTASFTWDRIADTLAGYYEDLLRSSPGRDAAFGSRSTEGPPLAFDSPALHAASDT
jgi:glycosyltransferase involved in cell wall biosynthesis